MPHKLELSSLGKVLDVVRTPLIEKIRNQLKPFKCDPPELTDSCPDPPIHPGEPPNFPDPPKWEDYKPPEQIRTGLEAFFAKVFRKDRRETELAETRFASATLEWEDRADGRESDLQDYQTKFAAYETSFKKYENKKSGLEKKLRKLQLDFNRSREEYESQLDDDAKTLDSILAGSTRGDTKSITDLLNLICLWLPIPLMISDLKIQSDWEKSILLIDLLVPNLEDKVLEKQLKTKTRPVTIKEIAKLQEQITLAIILRLIHEAFSTQALEKVEFLCLNARLDFVDRSNGQRVEETIASLGVKRTEFDGINIELVDPKKCFRSLKGHITPSFSEVAPVRPILTFDASDGRIVEGREVIDHVAGTANLAAMDWADFEHLIRELFSKMFNERSNGAEVNVTRASRDYGVDALVYDPDPIHGGKFIIQAKRYVNRVDVAAIRDLYGTLQNEGANRGFLVTTSSFGPDAYSFAKDKPLTLIDGQNLLQLLKERGYNFRVDLAEARRVLKLKEK